jgi:hypothetical protein
MPKWVSVNLVLKTKLNNLKEAHIYTYIYQRSPEERMPCGREGEKNSFHMQKNSACAM